MTIRNLSALFKPNSIALIGASNQSGSVGEVVARNLFSGGFSGRIFPVNPHASRIQGMPAIAAARDLPSPIDLAVVAIPAPGVPDLISQLGDRGCRAAVVITAGFDPDTRQKLLDAARPFLMRIIGPNGLGFLSPVSGVNASFSHLFPLKGGIAFITQSGAIATSIIDWANGRGVGFSHILSLGDMSDVDFGDCLDYLALDPDTKAILIYAETITQARKFMSAARIAARAKPVIVVKGGRSAAGAKAAASHTGALAGTDAVYDAAFRRAGLLRVDTLRDLFDAAETLASGLRIEGDRLAVLTNGGGLGVLAADALEAGHGRLARLPGPTVAALDEMLPPSWSHGNPVDLLGDAHGDRYESAFDVLAGDNSSDAILIMNCPTGVADNLEAAAAIVKARARHPAKPALACWMGEATAAAPRRRMSDAGLPNYQTPEDAVRAFLQLTEHARNQKALYETPASSALELTARRDDARRIVLAVQAEGRTLLTEPEAKSVLAAYNIPVVETRIAATPAEAGLAAEAIDGPVAIKILSRQITHKTDVGGVQLDLEGSAAVVAAATDMLAKVGAAAPHAVIDGFSVQRMIRRPLAQELILGATIDPTFGPCILFGHGGIAAEVIADRILGLPPLNGSLALDMISRTRVSRLLAGYRDHPPADSEAIAAAIVALSNLIIDMPEITELDINPLLADAADVIALDARIVLGKTCAQDPRRLAICPYPDALVRHLEIPGQILTIRPIRPRDADELHTMAERSRIEDLHLRFHGGMHHLSAPFLARLTQIDYDREMALVAEESDGTIIGVARLVFDPDFSTAECAILVRSDIQGRGVGRALMTDLLAYARTRGAGTVTGDILTGNDRTIDLARRMGASCSLKPEEPDLTRATFDLRQGRQASGARLDRAQPASTS